MPIDLSQFVTGTALNVSSLNTVFSSAVSSGSLISVKIGYFAGSAGAGFSNVVDNVNANNYTVAINSTMSNASDTKAHIISAYKAGISSGVVGGSTYRVSVNSSALGGQISICAMQFTGGAWLVGSTATGQGTSSSPAPGATTASSSPALWVAGAVHNSTSVFNSTINTGAFVAIVDPTNANQVLCVGYSTNSSLTQNPTFGMTSSTRWTAASIIFTGLGSGGAVTQTFVDGFPLFGCV